MSVEINTLKHGRQRHRRPATKSLARQRGAIGILGASVLLLSVLFTALAVDTGRLMLEQRRLQKIADMAALDGARALSCSGDTAVNAAVSQSAELNNHTGDILDVELGDTLTQGGVRVFSAPKDPDLPEAVRVIAGDTNVAASIVAGGWFGNKVNLQATAVAGAPTVGTLSVGSYLARLNTDDSILGPVLDGLLGTSGKLDLVSYKGLADVNVTLLDLINAQAEVGTVDKLLDSEISMQDFVLLAAEALSNQKEPPTVAIDLLETIAAELDADLLLHLGDLLNLDLPADQAALETQLNVLDLISLGAEVANKDHAVEVRLPISIPGIATATLTTYIVEPPKIAIGPAGRGADGEWITRAHTAQVNAELHLSLLDLLNLGATGLINLDLAINGAHARAGFESFNCTENGRNAVVGHAVQALRIGVGRFDDMSKLNPEIVPSDVVNLLGLNLIVITARADLGLGQSTEDTGELIFDPPFPADPQYTDNNRLGTAVSTLLRDLASNLEIEFDGGLGFLLNLLLTPVLQILGLSSSQGLLDLVANLLTPVLQALDPLLSGLLNALGISVAGADITVTDVEGGYPQLLI
ncbi:pilus assembly protein TadG-related protein [Methylobacter sp. sgz302048]|uniref:pilus assembly protein TadG-related protein n=1 Tax=Methylobacter sp. sgz302048 TaxID=3455945 RepID=UPI003F9F0B0B